MEREWWNSLENSRISLTRSLDGSGADIVAKKMLFFCFARLKWQLKWPRCKETVLLVGNGLDRGVTEKGCSKETECDNEVYEDGVSD